MKIGIIGLGVMGSNLARCLSGKNVELGYYNRSREKADRLAREIGGLVYSNPVDLLSESDLTILFLPRDEDVLEVVGEITRKSSGGVVVNASTITPNTSLKTQRILEEKGVKYIEAPVYGSSDEARECRLISIIASRREVFDEYRGVFALYSRKTYYVGEPPKAIALKLALNNLGLSMPALIAESLMILESHGVELEVFKEISRELWFGGVLDRYLDRVVSEKPVRFKAELAAKDYAYISQSLRAKGLPSIISSALYEFYSIASNNGYAEKDYPYAAKYFIDMAKKKQRQ